MKKYSNECKRFIVDGDYFSGMDETATEEIDQLEIDLLLLILK